MQKNETLIYQPAEQVSLRRRRRRTRAYRICLYGRSSIPDGIKETWGAPEHLRKINAGYVQIHTHCW